MKIAYLTSSFGTLSHTFIRREVVGLRALGLQIMLLGVRPEVAAELSDSDRHLAEETVYLYPIDWKRVLVSNLWFLLTRPLRYLSTLRRALFNDEPSPIERLRLVYHFFLSQSHARFIERAQAVHIHAHFPNVASTVAMYASSVLGISYSITLHSAGVQGVPSYIALADKLRQARFLVAISDCTMEYYHRIHPCRQKTTLIRCGLDLESFPLLPRPLHHDGVARLLAIGRLEEQKGFIHLIEACRLLQDHGQRLQLVIAGDGTQRSILQRAVQEKGLSGVVVFRGTCSQEAIKTDLAWADVVVVPSVQSSTGEQEGLPVVIMEALASGVPVVATRHAGIPELVRDRYSGLLVGERDPDGLAAAINSFLRDPQLVLSCRSNGRRLVSTEYDVKKTTPCLKELFESHLCPRR